MAQFTYKARSKSGEVMEGLLESSDRASAMSQLKGDGLFQYQLSWPKVKQPRQKDLPDQLKTRMRQKRFRKILNPQDGLVEGVIENLNYRNPLHGFCNWRIYCAQVCLLH